MDKFFLKMPFREFLMLVIILVPLFLGNCLTEKNAITMNVQHIGAKGDSLTLNTAFIQSAIDQVADKGGGVVFFPEGNYVTGTIILRSGVSLHLSEHARLIGSLDQADYIDEIATLTDGIGQQFGHALIYAANVNNISIQGGGVIDGRGFETYFSGKRKEKRPSILRFEDADSVKISGVTLTNAAFWVQHYRNSTNIVIDSVKVISHSNGNNDGIDIDGSSNVVIRNSYFDTGDDAIVLKSLSERIVKNVLIEHNTITGNKSAFKTGTESVGGFEDIQIRNLEIKGTRGINLYTVDGGDLRNIQISDIRMDSSYGVLLLRAGSRLNSFDGEPAKKAAGRMEQIVAERIRATNVLQNNEFISGLKDNPIRSVVLKDLIIEYAASAQIEVTTNEVPEKPEAYPKEGMFGPLPAYGLFIRNAENINIEGLQFLYPQSVIVNKNIPMVKCEATTNVRINWLVSSLDTGFPQVGCES
jgi:polygalacturonase